jgi:hypothetical protein
MANLRRSRLLLAFVLFIVSGCGKNLPFNLQSPAQGNVDPGNSLTGSFTRIDETTEDLTHSTDRPTILIFSQDTCQACGEEADSLLSHLAHPSANPSKAHLYTVLVGSYPEDAVAWKQLHPLPWEVGVDADSELFNHYCAIHTVPCVVVYLPNRGIVMRKNGEVGFDELTAITGNWEN